jgi:hypothetical protein
MIGTPTHPTTLTNPVAVNHSGNIVTSLASRAVAARNAVTPDLLFSSALAADRPIRLALPAVQIGP